MSSIELPFDFLGGKILPNAMEAFMIQIDAPVGSPLKSAAKQQFVDEVIAIMNQNGSTDVKLTDFHYVDRRSVDGGQSLIAVFQTIAPILSIAASSVSLARSIWQMNKKTKIKVKRDDGLFVELTDGMTEQDVMKSLNVGRNSDEGKKNEK